MKHFNTTAVCIPSKHYMILIAAVGVVAYAASVLFNIAHSTTSLSKDRYIEVSLSGAEASGSVRPGSTVALSPVLTSGY